MPWEIVFIIVFSGLVWLLDRDIDPYPPPLPRSSNPGREIRSVLLLWLLALGVNFLRLSILEPIAQNATPSPALRELIYLPLPTLVFLIFPLYLNNKFDHHPLEQLGLTWKSRSKGVAIFALAFGALGGTVAFLSGETVVGVTAYSLGALLFLLYNNAFLEEFLYRGVIQTRLERVVGQRRSILFSGLIFAASHVLLDFSILAREGGFLAVFYALLMQTLGGWLAGLIFTKTRTLWPGMVTHYLLNWLPSLLNLIF